MSKLEHAAWLTLIGLIAIIWGANIVQYHQRHAAKCTCEMVKNHECTP